MAPAEKKIYLESMIREVSRIEDRNVPHIVKELREMQGEIKS